MKKIPFYTRDNFQKMMKFIKEILIVVKILKELFF